MYILLSWIVIFAFFNYMKTLCICTIRSVFHDIVPLVFKFLMHQIRPLEYFSCTDFDDTQLPFYLSGQMLYLCTTKSFMFISDFLIVLVLVFVHNFRIHLEHIWLLRLLCSEGGDVVLITISCYPMSVVGVYFIFL